MVFNEEERLRIKKILKELEGIRGRHTELVSVYVPSGYSLVDIVNQLSNEKSTAINIKSKATRNNVVAALDKIIQHLRIFRQTPDNGLIVFCGNVSEDEGVPDLKIWSFEPPEKMNTKIYWCDQVFVLDPLKEMIAEKEVYGLIVLDSQDADIGLLYGKKVIPLKHIDSLVAGKAIKGGMSQRRYDRIREEAINEYFKEVASVASDFFLKQKELKGVLIGGPGPLKDKFVKEEHLNYQVQGKILGVKDIGYTGEHGFEELVQRSEELLKEAAVMKERQLIAKFLTELQKGGNVVYGYTQVMEALNLGALETLMVSEGFDWVRVKLKCDNTHEAERDLPESEINNQNCDVCGQGMRVQDKDYLGELLSEKAKNYGTVVELISTDTNEGQQFKKLGGIGGFLRYRIR
ncbi:MAG: peptide chain release factor aRF-1 [Candidatus Aenigmarchaeota archaeon]|nr:peptide chain release factor aRF-1 [Candidatus Aenigmarchaeota archaeon]